MTPLDQQQEHFAEQIVDRLREAGFEAYWAGGCVRDRLMGRTPRDFDVATSATPQQVRELFGHRRTLTIGAAFGVITVLGPKPVEPIEVATFRQDTSYSDGRHPDSVIFSSAKEDASRRDFTVNGLFYDPVDKRVIDFVGGCDDLKLQVIRAIGNPRDRFTEDKLRMLRAVRFSAAFSFEIDPETFAAIREMSGQIDVVSAERIAAEITRMLVDSNRKAALRLMIETSLATTVLPEIVAKDDNEFKRVKESLDVLERLRNPEFPLAMATLLHKLVDSSAARLVCDRWRLSNQQSERTCWLVEQQGCLEKACEMSWSQLQPILISPGIEDLLAMHEAAGCAAEQTSYCREKLNQPREKLDPPPLLTGNDLKDAGIPVGPRYSTLLQQVRDGQLDGQISNKAEAMGLVKRLCGD
jgi:poly(A) polymerase